MKRCSKCGKTKPLDEFYVRPRDGKRYGICKVCRHAYIKQSRIEHPERWAAGRRLRVYGVSERTYQSMLRAQDYSCAICRVRTDNLQVDHSHDTGEVRGLLCGRCNRGLGAFRESIGTLGRAIIYLRRWR